MTITSHIDFMALNNKGNKIVKNSLIIDFNMESFRSKNYSICNVF